MALRDLLNSGLNSNVGQRLVTAGADAAASRIYDATGFNGDGQQVGSPTAPVAAAPMNAPAEPAKPKKISKWVWFGGGTSLLLGMGLWMKSKDGK